MAEDRKARLAALAAKAGRNEDQQSQQHQHDDEKDNHLPKQDEVNKEKVVNFRNYAPEDSKLDRSLSSGLTSDHKNARGKKRTKYNTTDIDEDDAEKIKNTNKKTELERALLEAKVDAQMSLENESQISGSKTASSEPSVMVIAPKKVNWDLKRDIAKKLNRLERRTEKALVELLKERLEKEAEEKVEQDDLD